MGCRPARIVSIPSRRKGTREMANVVLINPFEVPEEQPDKAFLAGWQQAAEYLRQQPGFISTRLHRAISSDATFRFVNVAEWESPQAFQQAVASEGFVQLTRGRAPSHPALYEVVRTA